MKRTPDPLSVQLGLQQDICGPRKDYTNRDFWKWEQEAKELEDEVLELRSKLHVLEALAGGGDRLEGARVREEVKVPDYEKERKAHTKSVEIKIDTKVPSKWRFVDLETGDVWWWDENPRPSQHKAAGFKLATDLNFVQREGGP